MRDRVRAVLPELCLEYSIGGLLGTESDLYAVTGNSFPKLFAYHVLPHMAAVQLIECLPRCGEGCEVVRLSAFMKVSYIHREDFEGVHICRCYHQVLHIHTIQVGYLDQSCSMSGGVMQTWLNYTRGGWTSGANNHLLGSNVSARKKGFDYVRKAVHPLWWKDRSELLRNLWDAEAPDKFDSPCHSYVLAGFETSLKLTSSTLW